MREPDPIGSWLAKVRMSPVLLSAMLVLVCTGSAAAVQCQTSGKSWRLIDGRKCWFDGYRYLPKSQLHWGPSKQATAKVSRPRKARIAEPAYPVTGDGESDQGKQEGTADDRYRVLGTGLTFSAMQDRADQLRAELTKPKQVRTVLVSPIELIDTPPDLVPLPKPRPKTAPSPPEPRTGLLTWWLPLVLVGMMLGTVSRTPGVPETMSAPDGRVEGESGDSNGAAAGQPRRRHACLECCRAAWWAASTKRQCAAARNQISIAISATRSSLSAAAASSAALIRSMRFSSPRVDRTSARSHQAHSRYWQPLGSTHAASCRVHTDNRAETRDS